MLFNFVLSGKIMKDLWSEAETSRRRFKRWLQSWPSKRQTKPRTKKCAWMTWMRMHSPPKTRTAWRIAPRTKSFCWKPRLVDASRTGWLSALPRVPQANNTETLLWDILVIVFSPFPSLTAHLDSNNKHLRQCSGNFLWELTTPHLPVRAMTIDPVLSEDVSSLRAEIAELGKQIQIAGQTRQKDLARGPFIIVHQSWMRLVFCGGFTHPKAPKPSTIPKWGLWNWELLEHFMIYVTSYHITIHYSHCRIFSHGSLMVVGYVEKTCYYDFTQDKHDKLYRTPPKR